MLSLLNKNFKRNIFLLVNNLHIINEWVDEPDIQILTTSIKQHPESILLVSILFFTYEFEYIGEIFIKLIIFNRATSKFNAAKTNPIEEFFSKFENFLQFHDLV